MAANESKLGSLHDIVADTLLEALKGEVLPGYIDPETGEEVPEKRLPPSAAIIAAATKFLKDNNITCAPSEDNSLGELQQIMEARVAKKASRQDLLDAMSQAQFLSTRPN